MSSSVSRVAVSAVRCSSSVALPLRVLSGFVPSFFIPSSSLSSSLPINSFSVRSFSSGLLQPGPSRIKQTKRDLLTLLDDEARDLTRPDDEEMQGYMAEQGLKSTLNEKKNELLLTKTVENVQTNIRFLVEPDDEEGENPYENNAEKQVGEGEGENQEKPEGEEDQNEEQPPKPAVHSFVADLKIGGANGAPFSFLRVYAHADQNGQLIVDNLNVNEDACKKADNSSSVEDMDPSLELSNIQLEDLPEEAAEKVFELLNDLGIDDRLALFIQQYTFELRTKQHVEKINALKSFVNQIGGH